MRWPLDVLFAAHAVMPAQLVVITGANRGIGLGLCVVYHAAGHHVIAVCRNVSDSLARLGVQIVAGEAGYAWCSAQQDSTQRCRRRVLSGIVGVPRACAQAWTSRATMAGRRCGTQSASTVTSTCLCSMLEFSSRMTSLG